MPDGQTSSDCAPLLLLLLLLLLYVWYGRDAPGASTRPIATTSRHVDKLSTGDDLLLQAFYISLNF